MTKRMVRFVFLPPRSGPVEFACVPRVYLDFFWVSQLPLTVKINACGL